MTRDIVREARRGAREPVFVVTVAAYCLALLVGGYQSHARVAGQVTQAAAAVADMTSRWDALRRDAGRADRTWSDTRSASLVGGPSGYAVMALPIDRLAVLSAGESRRAPMVRRVSIYAADEEPPLENPLAAAGGVFDLAFVVIWLFPLAVIATCHALVCGDRQAGVWPLVAATTDTPGRLVAARLGWPALVLTTCTVVVACVCVAVSDAPPAANLSWRLLTWIAGVTAYGLFWVAVAALATIRLGGSAQALLALGLGWLWLVWLVPGLIDAVAVWRHPPVNRFEADLATRELDRDPESTLPALLEAVYEEHPDWRPTPEQVAAARRPVPGGPASRDSRRVYVPARAAARVADEQRLRIETWQQEVEGFVDQAAVWTPALQLQRLGDEVSGLDAARFARFADEVRRHEDAWRAFFEPRIMRLHDLTADDLAVVPLPGAATIDTSRSPHRVLPVLAGWATLAMAVVVASRGRLRG